MSAAISYWTISPEAVKALGAISRYVGSCGLEPKLVNLVYLRVSQINGCAYCCDMHTHDALEAGEKPQRLHVVAAWREADNLFNEAERAALAWAEALTRFPDATAPVVAARDTAWADLVKHYSEKQAVDLTFAISAMNAWNRIAIGFHRSPAPRAE
ncbi:MAG: carboxymuconolactone decarboxylase family protein [Tepidisphaeraceae bacterium]|jgi:AhpD family alkylhydroperoxidase